MAKFGSFQNITIENKDGKKRITVDGKELDLSMIVRMEIEITPSGVQIETESQEFLGW